jgi:mono/diheme cytochrome c family protein
MKWKISLWTLMVAALLAAIAAFVFVWSGVYNVGAIVQHTAPVYQLLEYAMRKSVNLRARAVVAPNLSQDALNHDARIAQGALLYRAHCLQCHGAPGVAPERFAMGMMPAPASLVGTAREWRPEQIYWAVSQGIKMSGMPAWEYRLSEQEIWAVVAFVRHLPQLAPHDYAQRYATGADASVGAGQDFPEKPERKSAQVESAASTAPRGDVAAGRRALHQYLCATCHVIPGVAGANKHVGPPLHGIATRKYIGGVLPNTPENMQRWLRDPQQFEPGSAMPNLGVSERDARDIAAFLATLDDPD